MLFALVLPAIIADLSLSKAEAGLLGSVTLVAAAAGGVSFGWVADRFGRTRALMTSVALYSVFTAACGFASTLTQFVVFRILLGLGMGGEWTSGAALVSESWPSEHRGKALGMMQSGWAIGYALAALVAGVIQPRFGWRAVFFVGILPAFFTLWIQRRVHEPEIWTRASKDAAPSPGFMSVFRSGIGAITVMLTLMNTCTLFAWWGFNLWIPAYLSLPVSEGGIGLSTAAMSGFVVAMQVGMWFGYVTFGYISDVIGRRRTYVVYLVTAAALMCAYGLVREPYILLALGPFVAFFATGHFSGLGTVTAEIYATDIRATAQGLTYNVGRIASAIAPFAVGSFARTHGYGAALSIASSAFLLAAVFFIWIPETKGRSLTT